MKANLTKEYYKKFNEAVQRIKDKHDVDVPHTVQYEKDGTFTVNLVGEIDLGNLDNLLSN